MIYSAYLTISYMAYIFNIQISCFLFCLLFVCLFVFVFAISPFISLCLLISFSLATNRLQLKKRKCFPCGICSIIIVVLLINHFDCMYKTQSPENSVTSVTFTSTRTPRQKSKQRPKL